MRRALGKAACLGALLALAACSTGGLGASGGVKPDQLFAPSNDPNAQGEDPLIVGYRLLSAGEAELALKSFRRAAADQGLTTEIISAMGTANLSLGRLGQAQDLMERATRAEDATPQDWNNLGVVLMERGKTAESVQIFKKAFALDNGASSEIRDNLRLGLAKLENATYAEPQQQNYKVVRRGSGEYLIRRTP